MLNRFTKNEFTNDYNATIGKNYKYIFFLM